MKRWWDGVIESEERPFFAYRTGASLELNSSQQRVLVVVRDGKKVFIPADAELAEKIAEATLALYGD
jgi:hypothetical protein